jgi:hypothetical protein
MSWLNKEKISLSILGLACLILALGMGWRWYYQQKNYFQSGSPPADIMDKIEPKSVPYEQIKSPAFLPTDALVFGSLSSTIGIAFYGDYANSQSNSLERELEKWVRGRQGKVRLVWYYLPAKTNDNDISFEAAVLSECSRLIDDNWQAHKLMVSVPQMDKKTLELIANQLETKDNMLYNCRTNKDIRDYLRQKIDIAKGDGIDTAPFVFVGTKAFPAKYASSSSVMKSALDYLHL